MEPVGEDEAPETVATSTTAAPKVAGLGDAVTAVAVDAKGARAVPVSVNAGVPRPITETERLPVAAPLAVGVNCTPMVQEPDTATGFATEQDVPEESIANGALAAMELKLIGALPELMTVND